MNCLWLKLKVSLDFNYLGCMGVSNKDHMGVVSKMVFPRLVIPVTHQQKSLVSGYSIDPAAYQT